MTETAAATAPTPDDSIFGHHRRIQVMVGLASVLCFMLFWWAAKVLNLPTHPKYEDSLLQQPGWVVALIATAILYGASVVIATAIAGRLWFFAGLLAASLGLAALSMRGGPSRYVLFWAVDHGRGASVFFTLAVETLLLGLLVGAAWRHVWHRRPRTAPTTPDAGQPVPGLKPSADVPIAAAVAVQCLVMALIVLALTPVDAKKGVLVSVFAGSLFGTMLAEQLPVRGSAGGWYFLGPVLVGAIGYLFAFALADPNAMACGSLTHFFAPLARPLPLDYASVGIAGALWGYWTAKEHPELKEGLAVSRLLSSATHAS